MPEFTLDGERQPYSPVCSLCQRLRNGGEDFHCDAFPDQEIPLDIWNGINDHSVEFTGDHGLTFLQVT